MDTLDDHRDDQQWWPLRGPLSAILTLLLFLCACGSDHHSAEMTTEPAADEWPVLNHDHDNSRANTAETKLSPDNVSGLVPRWRFDGLSAVTSTPAVVDGMVYFGD